MCVAGLLPQHIRDLISKYHQPYPHSASADFSLPSVSKDIDAMAAVLITYQDALNASSTEKVMTLYAPSAVFMPQHLSASLGTEAISQAYHGIFSTSTLHVKLNVAEIVPTNADWAFARTTSVGIKSAKTGEQSTEANQELYIFQKIDGLWKIARHCFCTTIPP